MSQNVLNSFLKAIGAKYTKEYLLTFIRNIPIKNNMYGLKMILHNYGIETKGLFFSVKKNTELTFPCILHIKEDSSDFVSALEIDADKITYVLNSKRYTKNAPEFCEMWTGNALVCESAVDNVIEPNYWKNVLTGLLIPRANAFLAECLISCYIVTRNKPLLYDNSVGASWIL